MRSEKTTVHAVSEMLNTVTSNAWLSMVDHKYNPEVQNLPIVYDYHSNPLYNSKPCCVWFYGICLYLQPCTGHRGLREVV